MIERIEDMPEGTVGLRFSGKIAAEDYEEILVPALREMVEGGEVRCLCELGDDFDGYEAGAMWEDLKTGARYAVGDHSAWRRMALLTDIEWIRHASALFGWMTPGELKVFALGEGDAARAWVAG